MPIITNFPPSPSSDDASPSEETYPRRPSDFKTRVESGPSLPQRSELRVSKMLSSIEFPAPDVKKAENRMSALSNPYDAYISSEEYESSDEFDEFDESTLSSPSPDAESDEGSETRGRSLSFTIETAKAVTFMFVGKPAVVNISLKRPAREAFGRDYQASYEKYSHRQQLSTSTVASNVSGMSDVSASSADTDVTVPSRPSSVYEEKLEKEKEKEKAIARRPVPIHASTMANVPVFDDPTPPPQPNYRPPPPPQPVASFDTTNMSRSSSRAPPSKYELNLRTDDNDTPPVPGAFPNLQPALRSITSGRNSSSPSTSQYRGDSYNHPSSRPRDLPEKPAKSLNQNTTQFVAKELLKARFGKDARTQKAEIKAHKQALEREEREKAPAPPPMRAYHSGGRTTYKLSKRDSVPQSKTTKPSTAPHTPALSSSDSRPWSDSSSSLASPPPATRPSSVAVSVSTSTARGDLDFGWNLLGSDSSVLSESSQSSSDEPHSHSHEAFEARTFEDVMKNVGRGKYLPADQALLNPLIEKVLREKEALAREKAQQQRAGAVAVGKGRETQPPQGKRLLSKGRREMNVFGRKSVKM
jgi:hypothetical protein